MDIIKRILMNAKKKTIRYLIGAGILGIVLVIGIMMRGGGGDGDLVQLDSQDTATESTLSEDGSGTDEKSSSEETDTSSSADSEESSAEASAVPEYIYIDVSGAVNEPSVVCMPAGSRVYQAIDAAGGRTAASDVRTINLAAVCEDGQKIYVPTTEEIEQAEAAGTSLPGQTETSDTSGTGTGSTTAAASESTGTGKININTAGSEELQTLTGVGPAIASKIIDYRNTNGSFQTIEDITNVSGIGEKTFEKFKDQICVG